METRPDQHRPTLLAVLAHPDDETFGMGGTLALYAHKGYCVHLVCATRGEVGDVEPHLLKAYGSVGELRETELRCASKKLGLAGVHFLGYRDSGMPGSPDNRHENALYAAPMEQVVEKVVRSIRQIRPQVVITFDPIGGYRHPDHIAIHQATVQAFTQAGNPDYLTGDLEPYAPQRLFFETISRKFLRIGVRVLALLGKDPRRYGRNRDIDLASLAAVEYPIHAVVDYTPVADLRIAAARCHESQGGLEMSRGWQGLLMRVIRGKESYMQGYPEPNGHRPVRDLFDGVDVTR